MVSCIICKYLFILICYTLNIHGICGNEQNVEVIIFMVHGEYNICKGGLFELVSFAMVVQRFVYCLNCFSVCVYHLYSQYCTCESGFNAAIMLAITHMSLL